MYKVMIVDDEDIIREGISTLIPWEELGFDLIGVAENGKEALELYRSNPADVIISDICMPLMNGIELTKAIKSISTHSKIIILSGYDQFEYAQNAIKFGVQDYILKPITSKELKSLLSQLREELDEEATEKEFLDILKKQVQENFPILKERFLTELVSFNISEDQIREKCTYFSIDLTEPPHIVLLILLDDGGVKPNEIPLFQYALTDICSDYFKDDKDKVVFSNPHGQTVIIMKSCRVEHFQEEVMFSIEVVKEIISEKLKATVSIGVGNPAFNPKDISLSYHEAIAALDYRFLLGNNQIIFISDLEKRVYSFTQAVDLERKLLTSLKVGTIDETYHLIEEIFFNLGQAELDRAKLYIMELIVMINKTFYELGIDPKRVWDESFMIVEEFLRNRTLNEIKDWLKNLSRLANNIICQKRNYSSKQYVEQAKIYIFENYSDKNLSLSSLCNNLLVSASYFSMIFKKETSMTFGEFLSKTRVEQAKQLLKTTNYKAYEIADKVGYNDQYYFSTVFKKLVGMSPTEFRFTIMESLKNGGD